MVLLPRTTATTLRAVFMSSYVPRECGIATFTEDLVNAVSAHGVKSKVVAMNRPAERYAYDQRVLCTACEDRPADYVAAAEAINRVNATPAAAMTAGTTCDTAAALPIQFTRCVTTTNVSTRLQRVVVVVLPLNLGWIPGDTVTLERANNVGPLDVLGGP